MSIERSCGSDTVRESALKVDWGYDTLRESALKVDCGSDPVRESALKVDCGRKIPCSTGDSNLRQLCAWNFSLTLYQLSYPALPHNRESENDALVKRCSSCKSKHLLHLRQLQPSVAMVFLSSELVAVVFLS